MKTHLQIAKNTLSRVLNSGVRAAIGVFMVPFLLVELGRQRYGLISLVGVFAGLTWLADLGLRPALTRHLAARFAVEDWRGASRLYSTAAVMLALIMLPIALGFSLATPWLVQYAQVTGEARTSAEWLFRWWMPCEIFIAFGMPIFTAPLVARNRFDVRNQLDTVSSLVGSGVFFALLVFTPLKLGAWVVSRVVGTAWNVWFYQRAHSRHFGELKLRPWDFSREDFRTLWKLGRYLIGGSFVKAIKYQLDPVLITGFLGVGAVALYRPGVALSSYARTFGSAFAGQMDNLATQFHARGEREKLHRMLAEGSRLNFLLGMPVVLVLMVFAYPIMHVWLGRHNVLGEEYVVAAQVLICMAIIEFLLFADGLIWPVLLGMNRIEFIIKADMGFAFFNLALGILLLTFTPLGVLSVVIASVADKAISWPVFIIHTLRQCQIPVKTYFWEVYAGPTLALVVLTGLAVLLEWVVRPQTLPVLLGCVTLMLVLWAAYAWLLGLNLNQRQRILGVCNRLLPFKLFPHAA